MFKKHLPFIKQHNSKECGVCSLAMIVKYYNGYISTTELSEMLKYTKDGISAYQLIEASKKLGFNAYGIKTNLEDYKTNIFPVIALIKNENNLNHYVVVYKIDYINKKVVVADPANKISLYSLNTFLNCWENIFIVLYPVTTIINKSYKNNLMSFYKQITVYNKNMFLKLYILSLILLSLVLLTAYFYEWIIEGINNNQNNNYYINVTLIYLSLYLIFNLVNYIRNNHLIKLSIKTNYIIMTNLYKQLINLPYKYYQNHTTGEILNKLNEISNIEIFFIKLLSFITFNIFQFIISIIIILMFFPYLFLIILTYIVVSVLVEYIYYKKYCKSYYFYQNNNEANLNYIKETIISYKTIKGINLEENFINKFIIKYLKLLKPASQYNKQLNMHEFIKNIIKDSLSIILVIVTIFNNTVDPSIIVKLFLLRTLVGYLLNSLSIFTELLTIYPKARVALQKIDFLFVNSIKKTLITNKISNIDIKNLIFSYDDKNNIVNDINLKITNNQKILLSGKTGSGKSTLLKLLLNYIQPDSGTIKFNNTVLNERNSNISYVSQESNIFFDTLKNNLLLNRNISNSKLNEIVEICQLEEIINSKNNGINSLVNEEGSNYSGGEKQRICLARALIKEFDVLIIDEGLSAVNNEIEYQIMKNIINYYKDKIIIVISHKSCIRNLFDKIYKIEKGKIYECI